LTFVFSNAGLNCLSRLFELMTLFWPSFQLQEVAQMKSYLYLLLASVVCYTQHSYAANTLTNPAAAVVTLQKSCGTTLNCSDNAAELIDWIWGIRHPSITSPLLVNIGPGTFTFARQTSGSISPLPLCTNNGNVTFRGAGRQNTVINGYGGTATADEFPAYGVVLKITNCTNLTFENLTIRPESFDPTGDFDSVHSISWVGGGNSVWNNVEVDSYYYGWIDKCSSSGVHSSHQWYASSITSSGGYYNIPMWSGCASTKFYGGELVATKPNNGGTAASLVGVIADGQDVMVEIYGSLVRSINEDPLSTYPNHNPMPAFSGHGGLLARNGATIHMHGGIVSVRSEGGGNDGVYGVKVVSNGMVHTPDTAFGLKASGTGLMERIIRESGSVSSPFQWPAGTTPPALVSVTGSDTFIETDCGPAGCQAGGNQPHLLIYSSSCSSAGPWFDSVTGACRVE
jgi:hypothetical protein